jgi:hypothetical protein
VDGEQIYIEWLVHKNRNLTGMTLDELTQLLQKEWQTIQDENKYMQGE